MNKLTKIYETNLTGYNVAKQLKSIDENAIYLVKDEVHNTKAMYRGEKKVGGDFIIEDTKPSTPETGIIYCIKNYQYNEDVNGLFLGVYENGKWFSFFDDLFSKIITDEMVMVNSIEKLAIAAGTITEDDSIGYVVEENSNYIKNATSVHNATVILDSIVKQEEQAFLYALDSKIENVNVNGVDGTVTNNKASVTINSSNISIAPSYTKVVYDANFNEKAQHVESNDKVTEAFGKIENTIKTLVSEVIANEKVAAEALTTINNRLKKLEAQVAALSK